jgi:hypothetical protein
MEWIAAAIVFVVLLVKFPRFTIRALVGVAGVSLVGAVIAFGYDYIERTQTAYERSKISVDAKFGDPFCDDPKYPIMFTIKNVNSFSVDSVTFILVAKQKGHSSELYSDLVDSDRIIGANEGWKACRMLDPGQLIDGKIKWLSPSDLDWSTRVSSFEKSD